MKRSLLLKIVGGVLIAPVIGLLLWNVGLHVYAVDEPITASPSDCVGTIHFAVIGDYGEAGQAEADVAALVDSWDVDFIVTVGDNNYPDGEASTIDQNIGQYYQAYIHNNDIPTYHEELVTVLHIKYPDSDLEILQSAFAGQIGQNGVNNRGVAVGINTLANLPGGDGLPVSFNVRKILGSTNLDEAIAYLQQARFAQAMNYTVGDREKVVCVETWGDKALVLDIYEGDFAVHTNHALGEGTPRTFEMTAEVGGGSYGFTMGRLALGTELLSADTAGVTLESFQGMFETRPILVYPGKPTGSKYVLVTGSLRFVSLFFLIKGRRHCTNNICAQAVISNNGVPTNYYYTIPAHLGE